MVLNNWLRIIFKSGLLLSIKSSLFAFRFLAFTNGWLLRRANSSAISFGDKIKSITPAAIAECGMLMNLAVSSWAKVNPPSCLMSFIPTVPSLALPERTMPITLSFCACAREEKRISIDTAVLLSER